MLLAPDRSANVRSGLVLGKKIGVKFAEGYKTEKKIELYQINKNLCKYNDVIISYT